MVHKPLMLHFCVFPKNGLPIFGRIDIIVD